MYAIRLKVVLSGQDTVDATNTAVAAASCSDCQTVAVAIEGVLGYGAPETVVPVNEALALNVDCNNCQTLAAAYQSVISTDGKVRMTGDGRRQIAQLRQQLESLRTSGLAIDRVAAEVDRIAGEFRKVLQTEVVPIGRPQPAAPTGTSGPADSPSPSTSPSPTPSGSTAAAGSPTASPSPSGP